MKYSIKGYIELEEMEEQKYSLFVAGKEVFLAGNELISIKQAAIFLHSKGYKSIIIKAWG